MPKTTTDLLARLAAAAGVPKKHVSAVMGGLAAQIEQSLSTTGTTTMLGLVKIERKAIPDCPTWPRYVKVTVVPGLLPGPDGYCVQGLHTYHESPATNDRGQPICGACSRDEIDWNRLHVRDIADVDYAVAQLKTDRFRHKWWSKDLDPAAVRNALRKGSAGIDQAIRKRVLDSVGRVYRMDNGIVQPYRDGAQTPFHGNVIYYGQHATATCCRKCIEVWHGIPRGRELTQVEMDYLCGLLRAYIAFKLPELAATDLCQAHPGA
jgi:hypothetical protein